MGYLESLNERQRPRVIAHEVGHAIDEMSGQIPIDGLNTELRQVYNTLYSGQERTRNLTGPQHLGYGSADVPRELMAEAIRGYMANPNWLKTVAPKTAARIREFVNNNPRVKDVIQFNTIAPIAIGTASALDADAKVHVRDSAAMAGVPSRYNVFEYGFPDLQNTSAGDQNLRATATNNAGPATGSASDSRVTSVFDTGSARIPYPYAGGLSGPFASASRSELSQDQPSAGGLLGLIQDYMRATQGERSGR